VLLYREIFFALDKNHSGELDLVEFEAFALSVLGHSADGAQAAHAAMDKFDLAGNGRLNFMEFVSFCEMNIMEMDSLSHLTKMLRGYVRASDRQGLAIREMWKRRSLMVDTICRVAIPLGFVLSLMYVLSLDEKQLAKVEGEDDRDTQWLINTSGFWVVGACCVIYLFYVVFRCLRRFPKKNSLMAEQHGIKDAFAPIVIQSMESIQTAQSRDRPGTNERQSSPEGSDKAAPKRPSESLGEAAKYPPEPGEIDQLLREIDEEEGDEIPNEPSMHEHGNPVVVDFAAAMKSNGTGNGSIMSTQPSDVNLIVEAPEFDLIGRPQEQ
jgi:hypothetical protein